MIDTNTEHGDKQSTVHVRMILNCENYELLSPIPPEYGMTVRGPLILKV